MLLYVCVSASTLVHTEKNRIQRINNQMAINTHAQAGDVGQEVLLWHLHLIHEDHACGGGSQ